MLTQIKRRMATLASVAAPLAFFALAGFASADDRNNYRPVIRKGVFEGTWHTDPVQIIIEKVHGDGTFSGQIHFDRDSRFPDFRCGFTARLGRNGSLTMNRTDCGQVARTGEPRRQGRTMVWRGKVVGEYLDRPYQFELRIRVRR